MEKHPVPSMQEALSEFTALPVHDDSLQKQQQCIMVASASSHTNLISLGGQAANASALSGMGAASVRDQFGIEAQETTCNGALRMTETGIFLDSHSVTWQDETQKGSLDVTEPAFATVGNTTYVFGGEVRHGAQKRFSQNLVLAKCQFADDGTASAAAQVYDGPLPVPAQTGITAATGSSSARSKGSRKSPRGSDETAEPLAPVWPAARKGGAMVAVPPPTAEEQPVSARSSRSAKKTKSLSSDKGKGGGSKGKKGGSALTDGSSTGRIELPEEALSVAGGVIMLGGCMAGGHAAPLTEAWVFSADSKQWYNVPTSVDASAVAQWQAASAALEPEQAELLPGIIAQPAPEAALALPTGATGQPALLTSTFTASAGAVKGGSDAVMSPPAGRAAAAVRWTPPSYPLEGATAWDPSVHGPCPRTGHSATINDEHTQVFLFGGRDACGQPLNDTWTLDLASWEWAPLLCPRAQAQFAPPKGGQGGLSPESLATLEEDGMPDALSVPATLPPPRAWAGLVWANVPECALKAVATPLYTLTDAPKEGGEDSPRGSTGGKSKKGGKKSPRGKGSKGGNGGKGSESMGGPAASLGAPPGSPWGLVPCLLMYGGASSRGIAQGVMWALRPTPAGGEWVWCTVDAAKMAGAAGGALPSLGARYGHAMLCLPVQKVVPARVLEAELAAAEEAVEAAAVSLSSSGGKGGKGGKSLKGGVPDVSSFTLDDATNASGEAVRTVHRLVVLGGVTQHTGGVPLTAVAPATVAACWVTQHRLGAGCWI